MISSAGVLLTLFALARVAQANQFAHQSCVPDRIMTEISSDLPLADQTIPFFGGLRHPTQRSEDTFRYSQPHSTATSSFA